MAINLGSSNQLFDNLVSKEEIAVELNVSAKTISNWMSEGKLPCLKIGRRNYALRSELRLWLEERRKRRKVR